MTSESNMTVKNRLSESAMRANFEKDGNRITVKISALIESSQERLVAAQGALEGENEALKAGKEYIQTLLAPCKDAIALLDLLSQAHPALSAITAVFKVVVQLELDRQENDRRIAALYFQITDLLFVLSYLNPVLEDVDEIYGKMKKELHKVGKVINEFGNFCDVYYKHNSIVRTILSGKYKGKLAEFSQQFSVHKKQLHSLVNSKSAVSISNIKKRIEAVSCKIDDFLKVVETMDPKEKEVTAL
ncbi:hypothetical protein V5O48_002067, partial [Marasmius crinis-equi]